MPSFDVAQLLQPISPESPSGEDLSYDPVFSEELEKGIHWTTKGDGMIASGEEPEEDEPDYKAARQRCIEFLGRSKDLRLGLYLTLASARLDGVDGLRDGLAVLRGLIEQFWDSVYPQLDPDDSLDPTERLNIVASMATPIGTFGDTLRFQAAIREIPLTDSQRLGRFTARQIAIANGQLSVPGGENLTDMATIEAAFKDTDPQELQRLSQGLQEAADHVKAIENHLTETVGVTNAIDLSGLATTISDVQKEVTKRLPASLAPDAAAAGGAETAEPAVPAVPGQVNSRDDVVQMLDRICDYYVRHEPSSPLPLILTRAKRLVHMEFMDILRDLSPETVHQVAGVMGIDNDQTER